MRVTSNALWSYPLHMDKYTEYMDKTELCLWMNASITFKDRLRGMFYSKTQRRPFVNKQVILVGKAYFLFDKTRND